MTFLNGLLALGTLAFTVPLLIHLLFRSRFVTVDWGAMHLLDSVVRINRKRMQWTHLLLLLLRCAIPIVLAFCLARPVLTGFQALPGDEPVSLVLVIDDSRSMSVHDDDGVTRLEQLKRGGAELLARLTRRDEVTLLWTSQIDRVAVPHGPEDAERLLRQTRGGSGPVDFVRTMNAALQAADEASHRQRQIVVVSDFQSHDLDDAVLRMLPQVHDRWGAAQDPPLVSFWNVGGDSAGLSNVAVETLEVATPAAVAGRDVELTSRIRNASDLPVGNARVSWLINGRLADSGRVSLSPRSTATVRYRGTFAEPGIQDVAVAIEAADALPDDNRRRLAVAVIKEVSVLLVDGNPGPDPLSGATDFLSIALSPFAFAGQQQPDAVRSQVVPETELQSVLRDDDFDVIVLANVANVSPLAKSLLVEFVHDGGALVMFDGDQVEPATYNEAWSNGDLTLSFPARLGPRIGQPGVNTSFALAIGDLNAQFAPWSMLGTADGNAFDGVEVTAYRWLLLPAGSDPTVLLELSNDRPLVVADQFGRGQLVQFAIPGNPTWSNLPLRTVFVPMLQQLMLGLARSDADANDAVGGTLVVPLTEFERTATTRETTDAATPNDPQDSVNGSYSYTVQAPGEPEAVLVPSTDAPQRLIYPGTSIPGIYRFRRFRPGQDDSVEPDSTLRVVEVDPIESRLRDATADRIDALAASVDGNVRSSMLELLSDDRTRRFGREIGRWLLALVVLLLVAEVFVEQGLRRRVTGVPNR